MRLTKHTETGALLFLCATLLVLISQLIVTRIVLLMLHTERDKASPFYFCTNSHVSSAEVNTSDHTLDLLCVSLGSVGGKAGYRCVCVCVCVNMAHLEHGSSSQEARLDTNNVAHE